MTKAPIKRATGSAKANGAWSQCAVKVLVLAVLQAFGYALVCGCPLAAWAADEVRWQYTVPFARGSDKSGATLEVDYGPVVLKEGKILAADLPANPQFPIECKVTPHQMGRRTEPAMAPASPVSQTFNIVGP